MPERLDALNIATLGIDGGSELEISAAQWACGKFAKHSKTLLRWFYFAGAAVIAQESSEFLVEIDSSDYKNALLTAARITLAAGLTYTGPKIPGFMQRKIEQAIEQKSLETEKGLIPG